MGVTPREGSIPSSGTSFSMTCNHIRTSVVPNGHVQAPGPVAPQQPPNTVYVSFSAEIIPHTTESLIAALTNFVKQRVQNKIFRGNCRNGGTRITADQIKLFDQHARLVFIHVADDDFDRKFDGLVHPVLAQVWIERWVAACSARRDGELDDAWFFVS